MAEGQLDQTSQREPGDQERRPTGVTSMRDRGDTIAGQLAGARE